MANISENDDGIDIDILNALLNNTGTPTPPQTTITYEKLDDIDMIDAILNKNDKTGELNTYVSICLKSITNLNDPRISKCANSINLDGIDETKKKIMFFYLLNRDEWTKDFVTSENNPYRKRKGLKLRNSKKFFVALDSLCEMYIQTSISDAEFLELVSCMYQDCKSGGNNNNNNRISSSNKSLVCS